MNGVNRTIPIFHIKRAEHNLATKIGAGKEKDVWQGSDDTFIHPAKGDRVPAWARKRTSVSERIVDAARFGHVAKLRSLCNNEQKLSKDLLAEALFDAVEAPSLPCVKLLLEQGADIQAQSRGGNATALVLAVKAGALDCVEFLLKSGADPHIEADYGSSPYRIARSNAYDSPERAKIFELVNAAVQEPYRDKKAKRPRV